MTEQNSTLIILEKIKAFAMASVGAGFISMGSTYFSEQTEYRIPRILIPIYELFGNVGLAIGMLILGAILMFFAYKKYTKNNGKSIYIIAFSALAIIGFYAIIFSTNTKQTSTDDIKSSIEKNQQKTNEEISNSERPSLENNLANKYLEKLEALDLKFNKSIEEKNKVLFAECEKEYNTLISVDLGNVVKEIATKPEYKDFAMYNAKVLQKIQTSRNHKW